jgi:hypothetical protein
MGKHVKYEIRPRDRRGIENDQSLPRADQGLRQQNVAGPVAMIAPCASPPDGLHVPPVAVGVDVNRIDQE